MVRFHSPRSNRNTSRHSATMVPDRSANRRLFRLILALGLVLIVMQRAGDPKVFRMFFPELQQTTAVQDDHLAPVASPFSDHTDSDDSTDQNAERINDSADDAALLESVSASALWTKADQPAFYRLLSTGGVMKHLTQPAQQTVPYRCSAKPTFTSRQKYSSSANSHESSRCLRKPTTLK